MDRGKYDLNAREYDVIRFYYRSQGISLGMIYDLETGILLHHTADYTSNLPTEEGGMVTRGQNAIMRLRNLRQVNIPWNDGRVPSWARGKFSSLPGYALILAAPAARCGSHSLSHQCAG